MQYNDLISDMVTRIKNGSKARLDQVTLANSKFSSAVLGALARVGYIDLLPKKNRKISREIEIKLRYEGKTPRIKGIKRISLPSKRVYYKIKNVKSTKSGFGTLILSTPFGVLTGKEAREKNAGGEALFKIW